MVEIKSVFMKKDEREERDMLLLLVSVGVLGYQSSDKRMATKDFTRIYLQKRRLRTAILMEEIQSNVLQNFEVENGDELFLTVSFGILRASNYRRRENNRQFQRQN